MKLKKLYLFITALSLISGCGKLQEEIDKANQRANDNSLISKQISLVATCRETIGSECQGQMLSLRPLSFSFYMRGEELPARFSVYNEKQELLDTIDCDAKFVCESYAEEINILPTEDDNVIEIIATYPLNQRSFKANRIFLKKVARPLAAQ